MLLPWRDKMRTRHRLPVPTLGRGLYSEQGVVSISRGVCTCQQESFHRLVSFGGSFRNIPTYVLGTSKCVVHLSLPHLCATDRCASDIDAKTPPASRLSYGPPQYAGFAPECCSRGKTVLRGPPALRSCSSAARLRPAATIGSSTSPPTVTYTSSNHSFSSDTVCRSTDTSSLPPALAPRTSFDTLLSLPLEGPGRSKWQLARCAPALSHLV